jgi:hypothetical protein
MGICSLPLAAPTLLQGTLLPCAETSWNAGKIGINEPLFSSSFNTHVEIGSFASACQASHILGLVLRHRDDHGDTVTDPQFRLSEAQRLHKMLVALTTHLTQRAQSNISSEEGSTQVALTLCFSARMILYNLYACNEHVLEGQSRLAEETEMQWISFNGLKEVSQSVALHISELANSSIPTSPLVCHCLYQASEELAWFIKEDNDDDMASSLSVIVKFLMSMSKRWRIAGEFLFDWFEHNPFN